jgi:hypothetical protein
VHLEGVGAGMAWGYEIGVRFGMEASELLVVEMAVVVGWYSYGLSDGGNDDVGVVGVGVVVVAEEEGDDCYEMTAGEERVGEAWRIDSGSSQERSSSVHIVGLG